MSEKSLDNPILKLGPNPTGQVLYFFGARHINDSTDVQFSRLRQFWNEFLNIVKEERVVFTEGIIRAIASSYEDSIQQYGEAGAAQWLAREADVVVTCTEPSNEDQRKLLCALFSPQVVAYTMIVQNLTGWFRHKSQTSFEEAVARVLNREAKFSGIYGFAPDKIWLYEQHKKLFDKQPLEDKNFLDSISDPRKKETLVNTIVTFRTKIRNEYLLSVIGTAWKSGKSIFIVYGMGHLADLEHSLQNLSEIEDISNFL